MPAFPIIGSNKKPCAIFSNNLIKAEKGYRVPLFCFYLFKYGLIFLLILPHIKDSLLLKLLDFLFAVPQIFQDLRSLLSD